MKPKGDGCWTCTRAELLEALRAGAVLRNGKFGPHMFIGERPNHKELHPRRDTCRRLLGEGMIAESDDANAVQ